VSPEETIERVIAALSEEGATSAEQEVHDSLTKALGRSTDRAIVVRETRDVLDSSASSMTSEGRRLHFEVVGITRKVAHRRTLSREIRRVLAALEKELRMQSGPNVEFSEVGADAQGQLIDRPVFAATHTVSVPYRELLSARTAPPP
jgi:hypothetical protein